MCGIVGMAIKANNGFTKKEEDIFWDMLYADTLRGDDATGVIFVEKNGDFGIMKEAQPAHWAASTMRYSNMGKAMFNRGKALIGHNRKATVGAVKDDTSHPFVVNSTFAMVHNGTLSNHRTMHNTTVDSEALAMQLHGVMGKDYTKEAFEEAIGKVNGAYAVAGYNQETNKVFLTRNKERPLALIETPTAWYWASEFGMLSWILSRNGVDISKSKSEFVKEDVLYEIDLTSNTMTKEEYVPKKAQTPPVHHRGVIAIGHTTTTPKATVSNVDKLSKNSFKKIKKGLSYQTVTFFADDYVEKRFPATLADGETEVILLGETEDVRFPFKHSIRAYVDLAQYGPLDEGLFDQQWSGRVYDMDFNPTTGTVTLLVDRVNLVPASTPLRDKRRQQLEEAFEAIPDEELEELNPSVCGTDLDKQDYQNEITSALH